MNKNNATDEEFKTLQNYRLTSLVSSSITYLTSLPSELSIPQFQSSKVYVVIILQMSQGNSKTEKLLFQNSYRKHRQRLADIRHNITTQDFKIPPRYRIEDKKRQMMDKMKNDQIQSENNILQHKIDSLKVRANSHLLPAQPSIQANNNQFTRYEGNFQDDKLEIKQNFIEGQTVKFIVPGVKARASSFTSKAKGPYLPWVKRQNSTKYESNNLITKKAVYSSSSQKRVQVFNATSSQKAIGPASQKKKLFFNEPERNEQRQVLHKRTIILSSTQSCLLELSLLDDRMVIAAYLMGSQNYCIKQILNAKKTLEIIKDYEGNYDEFCSKISIQQLNQRYQLIKLPHKETTIKLKDKNMLEDKLKEKVKIQQQFLKRNYYTLHKNQEESASSSKDKPTITHQKVQEIVERLAAPKRYLVNPQNPTKKVQLIKQQPKPVMESKVAIHIQGERLSEIKNIVKNQKESPKESKVDLEYSDHFQAEKQSQRYDMNKLTLKRTESIDCESNRSPKRSEEKRSFIQDSIAKKVEPIKHVDTQSNKDEEGVQYLDGQQYGQDQFQNPSQFLKEINESNPSKVVTKSNKFSNKQEPASKQKPKNVQPTPQYAQLFEQGQNYDETFELQQNNSSLVKLKESIHSVKPSKGKSKVIEEQEYAQQFQG